MSLTFHLARKQGEIFEKDNVGYMKSIPFVQTPQSILLGCYEILVRQVKVKKIEELSEVDQRNIWDTAKEFAAGRLNKEELIRLSKCLYALEYILTM